jgi:hypothetical protein
MKKVVDVVNLNADASCLSTESWFSILKGGTSSVLYNFLNTYVHLRKKISLGIIGATLVDMVKWNPEAVALIRSHRDIFEIILRPFSHDVALLRSPEGFALNFRCGRETLEKEFGTIEPYFLPPEFMLTNYQLAQLVTFGVQGTFVNANRFTADVKRKIPVVPYMVRGVNQTSLACIPMFGDLTRSYLDSIHYYDAEPWNKKILSGTADVLFSWRDGESPFLIPDGNERERSWLASESPEIERLFVSEASKLTQPLPVAAVSGERLLSYPVHSFLAWVKEFRMLGFVQKVSAYEERLKQLKVEELSVWLSVINSDILSAVEKTSPVVTLRDRATGKDHSFTIWRSERGFEGEDFLYILDNLQSNPKLVQGSPLHIQRLANRSAHLATILKQHDGAC